jgi:hypothetical protein
MRVIFGSAGTPSANDNSVADPLLILGRRIQHAAFIFGWDEKGFFFARKWQRMAVFGQIY